jgi:hypothetical protein
MEQRHDLFLELDAFDPKWQQHFATTELAAAAAGACAEWRDYCRDRRNQATMTCTPSQVRDTAGQIRREQEAAAISSLPYRLDTIGYVRQVEE